MKTNGFSVSLTAAVLFSLFLTACPAPNSGDDPNSSPQPPHESITGTVASTTNVKVGFFAKDLWFQNTIFWDLDFVYDEFDQGRSGSFTPIAVLAPNADGTFTLSLPSNISDIGNLIAWEDTDADSLFDLETEQGFFAQKTIDANLWVATDFEYVSGTVRVSFTRDDPDGVINLYDQRTLDGIGTSGYNFNIRANPFL